MNWRAKVELYEEIRREYEFGVGTIRGSARKLGVHRRMVREAIVQAVPPRRKKPERRAGKLRAVLPIIDRILEADRQAPRKQRHTAHWIWERLRLEVPDWDVSERAVRKYVSRRKAELGLEVRETCVPQSHDWGVEAHADWYEAWAVLVGSQVGNQVREQVRNQSDMCWGQHDAGWLSWLDYFRVVAALSSVNQALGLIRVAQCCGWWWPKRRVVIFTERPARLERDNQGRLHSETSAAIEYPDGWGIFAWHGIRVSPEVILEKDRMTVQQILSEPNTEVRRAMRNLYGNERFMRDAGAKEISRSDKHGCRLLRIHLPGDRAAIQAVELTCPSTGSKYLERVPPDVQDAVEALSWRFQIKPEQYAPEWET